MANPECAIGIDIGGTKIAGGILDTRLRSPVLSDSFSTNTARGGEVVLDDCLRFARRLLELARLRGFEARRIGVGVPETVTADGRITSVSNFDWRGTTALERFASIAPTVIEADVRAAALAEARIGVGRKYANFAYLSLGTGISYTLVLTGIPVAGARGNALILASGIQTHRCPSCSTLSSFVLEEFASGAALTRRYNELAKSALTDARAIFAAAEHGDTVAQSVLTSAGDALGAAVGFMVNLLDPGAIVVGGGLGLAGGMYRQQWESSMRAHIWSPETSDLPVEVARLGSDAGWIGAALMAADRYPLPSA